MSLYSLARPLLFSMDPEEAHHLAMRQLRLAHVCGMAGLMAPRIPDDPVDLFGLRFRNPVGLAAGLDKNGEFIDALARFGFGFIEVGTVTPLAQPGNPRPRMFRLPEADALINRMGFNNEGLDRFIDNVRRSSYRSRGGVLGLNIGKNAATPIDRAVDDYLVGMRKVYPHADYITVNISSPNTRNLRQLQGGDELDALIGRLRREQDALASTFERRVPMLLKIAPDLDEAQVEVIADTLLRHGVDGVIATNTTVAREAVRGLAHASEAGGLSGRPVAEASTRVIAQLARHLGQRVPIIGVGGILGAEDALAKRAAGARLVQVYTGLIYRGPALVAECARALRQST